MTERNSLFLRMMAIILVPGVHALLFFRSLFEKIKRGEQLPFLDTLALCLVGGSL